MNTEQKLLENLINQHPGNVLSQLDAYTYDEIASFLTIIPASLSGLLISKMEKYRAIRILELLDIQTSSQIIEELPLINSSILLRQGDPKFIENIMALVTRSISSQLRAMIQYPKNWVGAVSDPEVFTLFDDLTVEQSLTKIKNNKLPIYLHLFIINREQTLVGYIVMDDVIKSKPNQKINAIMHKDFVKIRADISIDFLIEGNLWDEQYLALPVVDANDHFLGVITKSILSNIQRKDKSFDRQASAAGKALGELYRIGLSSLLHSATQIPLTPKTK